MPREDFTFSTPGWVVDHQSIDLNTGRQIDWDSVAAAYENNNGNKEIPNGTVMAELGDGRIAPRAGGTVGSTVGILIGTAVEGRREMNRDMYGLVVGGVIFQNLLPEFGDADFATMVGELGDNGTGFVFETYADSRLA